MASGQAGVRASESSEAVSVRVDDLTPPARRRLARRLLIRSAVAPLILSTVSTAKAVQGTKVLVVASIPLSL